MGDTNMGRHHEGGLDGAERRPQSSPASTSEHLHKAPSPSQRIRSAWMDSKNVAARSGRKFGAAKFSLPAFFCGLVGEDRCVCAACIGNQIHRRRANSPALAQIVRTQLPTPRSVKSPLPAVQRKLRAHRTGRWVHNAGSTTLSVPECRSYRSYHHPPYRPVTIKCPKTDPRNVTITPHAPSTADKTTPHQTYTTDYSQERNKRLQTDSRIKKHLSSIRTATLPPRVVPRWPCTSGTGA